ncbi:heterogeneous nuclear ribonucleoprotein 1-like [Gastrolobium bilobum]|uniref:heterogeneous nuclear ribonucleoprotein 1-like n=1 Tax=Gastrolobium bilobum TaxID=150636 RepID=UPI002AB090CB|nr:heterogeneous nuclear ribonucleoprotein 1-like [Gastrolobium bilobum]XP_061344335.1 heterogeneous nuclear ribonucleoprotein 1-like [Gastrolobium bilobum]
MEMDPGKLFIGGISWDTNEDRLRQYFQNFGDVVEAVIMKDRNTGRARGFGFIVFADPSVAEQVVMEKHVIDGRTVEAKKAVPRDDLNVLNRSNSSTHGSPGPAPTRTKKIFVGGLASTVTESDFKKYFDQFGTITDVVVMYDHNTQRPRGFGFITYDSEEGVDKVLCNTFHELNGKMVEVKRAVPKELSPGPSRGQLGGYSYGISRVSSFPNGCIPGYNPSLVGGLRIDARLSPVAVGRSGYPLLSPSYGTGLNFEPPLSQNENANFPSNFVIERALNYSYSGSPSRYNNAMRYAGTNAGNNSTISSISQNLWGNRNLNYVTNPTSSDGFAGYGSENSSMGSLGTIGSLWSSSLGIDQAGTIGSGYGKGNLNYRSGDVILGSKTIGYGKSNDSIIASASSFALSNGSYDEAYKDTYEAGSFYWDHAWRSSTSELEDSGSLSFDLENAVSDLMSKSSAGHIGAYTVATRQSNRGIAA